MMAGNWRGNHRQASLAPSRRKASCRGRIEFNSRMPLSSHHIATLNAAANRIVPPDDGTPGAIESGAAAQLIAMLDGDLAHLQPDYEAFLAQLDVEAQVNYGPHFADLRADQQDTLLQSFQTMAFFRLFTEHVQEQFWTTPAALQLVGFEVRA